MSVGISFAGGKVEHRCGLAAVSSLVANIALTLPSAAASPDQIVVQSTRIDQDALSAPQTVTVFSAQDIRDARIETTLDLFNLTPNVSLTDAYTWQNTNTLVRGLAHLNNGESPISIYVDGVSRPLQRQTKMLLVDVAQIEVARGSQGAAFGMRSSAGAINITTKPPTSEISGLASISYGSGGRIDAAASLSDSLSDSVRFRLTSSYTTDGGRIKNTFLNDNVDAIDYLYLVRAKVEAALTPALSATVTLERDGFDAGSIADVFVPTNDPNDIRSPTSNRKGNSTGGSWNGYVQLRGDFDGFAVTSVTGFARITERSFGDLDFSNPVNNPLGAFNGAGQLGQTLQSNSRVFNNETVFTLTASDRLTTLLGVAYEYSERDFPARLFFDDGGDFFAHANDTDPARFLLIQDVQNRSKRVGGFAQAVLDITDRLSLDMAVRYEEVVAEQQDFVNDALLANTFEGFQPRLAASYQHSNTTLYVSCGRGFRPGIFNTPSIAPARSEEVDTCDMGLKGVWLNNRLRINAAYFHSWVHNYQAFLLESLLQRAVNLEDVRISGVEIETSYQPTDWLMLSAAFGTTDSEIKDASAFPSAVGNKTPRTIDSTLNLTAQIRKPVSGKWVFFARTDYRREGERTWQLDNLDVQEPFSLLNGRVGVEHGRIGAYIWGRNLTDAKTYQDYYPAAFSGIGNYAFAYLIQPRMVGFEITTEF